MGLYSIAVCFLLFVFICNATRPYQIWKFCYKNLCMCNTPNAVCTEHGVNLTYIPALPSYTRKLNFSYNQLSAVNQQTFFNVSRLNLKMLVLTSNKIIFISADAFDQFKNLKNLELSGNPIGLASLKGVLQSLGTLPLDILVMTNMNYKDQLYEAIVNLHSSTLGVIHLEKNHLTIYNQTSFKHMSNLEKIALDDNDISHVYLDHSPSLKTISFNRNSLFTVPDFCNTETNPRLTSLFLDYNRIVDVNGEKMACLKQLSILSFNSNPIKRIKQNAFVMLRSLHALILRSLNEKKVSIENFAFNSSSLFRIDLRDNHLQMHRERLSPRMFWGCVNLKRLSLSYNQFYYVNDTRMKELFYPLKQLTYLELGSCGMMTIPKAITMHLTKLNWLSLYQNHIQSWSPDTFVSLKSLTELYLMGNLISSIQENSFPNELCQQLKYINLADNPFDCSCNLVWFLNWFKTNRAIFKQFDHSYKCSSPSSAHNVQLIHIQLSEQQCLLPEMTIFIIVTVTSVVVITIIVCSLVYRKRWSLKHYWYMRGYRNRRRQEIERDYTYDICVIYCEEDQEWVTQEMLPFLEDTKGLTLCIQQRDFALGKAMIDCIVESVQGSRGFILVASNNFVDEEWCQYQLQLAHKYNDERNLDLFVVILLEEIDHRHMTPSLYAVLKMREPVVWPEDDTNKERFWKLVYREITH